MSLTFYPPPPRLSNVEGEAVDTTVEVDASVMVNKDMDRGGNEERSATSSISSAHVVLSPHGHPMTSTPLAAEETTLKSPTRASAISEADQAERHQMM